MKSRQFKHRFSGLRFIIKSRTNINGNVFIYINSLFFLFLAAILLSCKEKPRNAIEKTILNYDWKGIVNECKKIDPSLESPVNKALVGHASIMLNRNNESFVLFNFLDLDRKGMKMLQKWTDDLTKRFPKNAIAFYLKGDALVRNGDRKEALQCFEKSISLDKSFSLAYNACGLLYSIDKNKSLACMNFDKAIETNDEIAEFYFNRATMFYNHKAPEYAYRDYSKALTLSGDFALAMNGKACAMIYYCPKKGFRNEDQLDTIYYYLLMAEEKLPMALFRQNTRQLILEFESRIYPDQIENPYFRFSDFLNWNLLYSYSDKNDCDAIKSILGQPLPLFIDLHFLMNINKALENPQLFTQYIKMNCVADSITKLILTINSCESKIDYNKYKKMVINNRIIIERLYPGLIANFKQRDPGMGLQTFVKSYPDACATSSLKLKFFQERQKWNHQVWKPASEIVKWAGAVVASLPHPITKASGLGISTAGIAWGLATDRDIYETQKKIDHIPGGVLADIRRAYIDNDKQYSLICIYGMGYGKD